MQPLYLAGYWGPRRETLTACLKRVERWIEATNAATPTSVAWFEDRRRRGPPTKIAGKTQIKDLLLRSRQFSEIGPRRVFKDLGFGPSLTLRSGNQKIAQCRILCGCTCVNIKNLVLIEGVENLIAPDRPDDYRHFLKSAVEIWQFDWAAVFSDATLLQRPSPAYPFVDWMVYLSDELLPEPPKLIPPTLVEPCANGTLIIVQEQPPDHEDLAQKRRVKRVAKKIWGAVAVDDAEQAR